MFDLSAKRELNNGFGNALSTAVELAVTPAIFAWIGWRIDEWLGTTPFVFLFLFLFTFCYVVWRKFSSYETTMRRQEQELLDPHRDREAR